MKFSSAQKAEAAAREVRIRQHRYRNLIMTGRMSKAKADYEIAVMEAIAQDYAEAAEAEQPGLLKAG